MRSGKLVFWAVVVCLTSALRVSAQQARPDAHEEAGRAATSTAAAPIAAVPEAPTTAAPADSSSSNNAAVPQLIKFSGTLVNLAGKPVSGAVDVTFSLYSQESGGTPLWFETQTVEADSLGRYSVLLGAMTPTGVPMELFTSGEAHWLGVQVSNLPEQARVLLVSVPYAMKAGDAQTLGGRPASAYQLTSNCSGDVSSPDCCSGDVSSPDCGTASGQAGGGEDAAATGATAGRMTARKGTTTARGQEETTNATKRSITPLAVTTSGPTNFSGATTDQIVGVTQTGSGTAISATAGANNAIVGTTTTASGAFNGVEGIASSPNGAGVSALQTAAGGWALYGRASATTGPTVATQGINDSDRGTAMSGWERADSGTTFGLVGDVASSGGTGIRGRAYATYGNTTGILATVSSPTGTGLVINNLAGGKLFSGQNNGTEMISMTATNGSAAFAGSVQGSQLVSTVSTGTAPLSVASTTQVANLNASLLGGLPASAFQPAGSYATTATNTFTATQTVSSGDLSLTAGNLDLPATNSAGTAGVITLGGSPLIHACCSNSTRNTFVGPSAGNFTADASSTNSGMGNNTAVGYHAMQALTTGFNNSSMGSEALIFNTTGSYNSANGYRALYVNTTGSSNTALGDSSLYYNTIGNQNTAVGQGVLAQNTTGGGNTAVGGGALQTNTTGSDNTALGVAANVGSNNLHNATAIGAFAVVSTSESLVLGSTAAQNGVANTKVGIGTSTPLHTLDVVGDINATGNIATSGKFSGDGSLLTSVSASSATTASGLSCTGCVGNTQLGVNYAASDSKGGDAANALLLDGYAYTAFQAAGSYATLGTNTFAGDQSVTGTVGVVASASGATAMSVQATELTASNTAVSGIADGADGTGVVGQAMNGSNATGVWGISSSGEAGLFQGDVSVTGTLSAAVKNFKIDDPLDPANKFLVHASVESSELKTVYDGAVTLDANGAAVVQLPDWFQALNGDFRYQLTCVGGYAPVYIAQKIKNNAFKIAGGTPGLEVDWQVTGVRHDPYAEAHPLRVERQKTAKERGYYLHPELYGQPSQRGIEWADHPGVMARVSKSKGNH